MSYQIIPCSSIIGQQVQNSIGNNIGEIKDIMIDPINGKVVYAVLSFGGLLGIGNKYFSVPMQALKVSANGDLITLDVNKEKLTDAPHFGDDDWPVTTRPEYMQSILHHYDITHKDSTFR